MRVSTASFDKIKNENERLKSQIEKLKIQLTEKKQADKKLKASQKMSKKLNSNMYILISHEDKQLYINRKVYEKIMADKSIVSSTVRTFPDHIEIKFKTVYDSYGLIRLNDMFLKTI